jgi:hypothetical protein
MKSTINYLSPSKRIAIEVSALWTSALAPSALTCARPLPTFLCTCGSLSTREACSEHARFHTHTASLGSRDSAISLQSKPFRGRRGDLSGLRAEEVARPAKEQALLGPAPLTLMPRTMTSCCLTSSVRWRTQCSLRATAVVRSSRRKARLGWARSNAHLATWNPSRVVFASLANPFEAAMLQQCGTAVRTRGRSRPVN